MKKHTKIKKVERHEIALLLGKGYGVSDIGRALKRSKGTISEEIKRNSVNGVYDPIKANHKSYINRKYSKYQGMKVNGNENLEKYIVEKILSGWSPELIAGRIKEVDSHIKRISFKGIYKYVESVYGRKLERYLPRYGKRSKKGRFKVDKLEDRVFIDQRPKIVEKKQRFGDWEGDFIVSGKNGKGSLLVLRERKARFSLLRKVLNLKIENVHQLIFELTGGVVINTLTLDNDIVFKKHKKLSMLLGVPVYFCHPYHSWEKGGVENVNKAIRKFIPKGSDISKYSDEYIQWVEDRLNDRPMKCLRFKTPREVMVKHNQFKVFKKEVEKSMISTLEINSQVFGLRG